MNKLITWMLMHMNLNPTRKLAFSFFIVIVAGALLLKLPISHQYPISWSDAFFTATSATTVTGLAVVDIGEAFTIFGQIVIMLLIQFGGTGTMVFAIFLLMMFGKKIGLKERLLVQNSLNQNHLGGIIPLVRSLLLYTFIIEGIGFLFLSFRWVPEFGWKTGLFVSLFHSVSAFNNAGFSLWKDNLSAFVGDPIVNIVISILFIIGGIGFIVMKDIWKRKRFQKLSLHSKLMIVGTLLINVIATLMIFFLEYGNGDTIGNLSISEKWFGSYFQAVTTRTAGFNTLDIGAMTPASLFFMMGLMFIGAGSASTAGGIKLTTFIILIFSMVTYLTYKKETVLYHRAIKKATIFRSLTIVTVSLLLIFVAIFILTITEKFPFIQIAFEVFSSFGTVGLSTGITGDLSLIGKIVIIVMMFIGRIGPLTFAFLFTKKLNTPIRYPEEEVFTG
ncbi:TrkH family potassium uptake protein [Fervidibacillus halotolerans]|uniref:TrkH family potassium uptake protein n=1 Tax=Fervidibacillus halotolerans TaxID=2980027 RepID=A0A9E8M0J5_9BACI|nr:TrkH family potassium uptake protein [Fervidibacillus halotolerans]WAA13180.1 TrkH family potassium uptake protein [Fervidibacillus halotolerans]